MNRRQSSGSALFREAALRFGSELRTAAAGMPQREIARRAGVSQSLVSRVMDALVVPDLRLMLALSDAVGHRLSLKLFPGDGVGLRDSGQMAFAEVIRQSVHASWTMRLEVPVSRSPDRRAADVLLANPRAVVHIEIERTLVDFQAQLRAAQLKRAALAEHLSRRVDLAIAVPDTPTTRQRLVPHASLVAAALPVSSRGAWAALRSGEGLDADALLWIRRRPSRGDARGASNRA